MAVDRFPLRFPYRFVKHKKLQKELIAVVKRSLFRSCEQVKQKVKGLGGAVFQNRRECVVSADDTNQVVIDSKSNLIKDERWGVYTSKIQPAKPAG